MSEICPACGGPCEFLGNESETGKSWYKCLATLHVFSLILDEKPRFDFQGRD